MFFNNKNLQTALGLYQRIDDYNLPKIAEILQQENYNIQ